MRVKRRGRDGRGAGVVQEAGVGLERVQEGAIDVEEIDIVALRPSCENRRMLMHRQRAQRILCRPHRP